MGISLGAKMQNLTGKTVFISGASSGIGAACAKQFAAQGARLIICARRFERLQLLANDLMEQYQTEIYPVQLDVTDSHAVQTAIEQFPLAWRSIDILLNNAGLALGRVKFSEGNLADWETMLDTNVKGILAVTRSIVPGMIARKAGHVINIGSIAGHQVYPDGAVYCASKHAVKAITEGLRMDLLGSGVRVSTIDPGLVETEFSIVRFAGDTERAKQVYSGLTPLSADDVADAIIYCASRPAHVNIAEILLLPTAQASAIHVHRVAE